MRTKAEELFKNSFGPPPPISLYPPGKFEAGGAIPRRCLRSAMRGLGSAFRTKCSGASLAPAGKLRPRAGHQTVPEKASWPGPL